VFTAPQPGAPAPATPNPNTVNFVENLERLKLDFDRVLPLHGPGAATKAELYKFAGKSSS
jgi:glyoxylase-like metal-dependent hydrolase (beta-lactamase superfamily II)